jgi:hypothetical protein
MTLFLLSPASQASKTWCVAKPSTEAAALQDNLDFACSESDCGAIQGTGGCTRPDSLLSRASVAMNAYYQARGRNSWNCFFNGTGLITITDPSKQRVQCITFPLGSCRHGWLGLTWLMFLQVLAPANMLELGGMQRSWRLRTESDQINF